MVCLIIVFCLCVSSSLALIGSLKLNETERVNCKIQFIQQVVSMGRCCLDVDLLLIADVHIGFELLVRACVSIDTSKWNDDRPNKDRLNIMGMCVCVCFIQCELNINEHSTFYTSNSTISCCISSICCSFMWPLLTGGTNQPTLNNDNLTSPSD